MKTISQFGILVISLFLSFAALAQNPPAAGNGNGAPPSGGMGAGGPQGGPPGMQAKSEVDHSKECDSQCLRGIANTYLAALAANDISMLNVNPGLRVSENSHAIALGDNSWKTIEKINAEKLIFTDPFAGQALVVTTVEMGVGQSFIYSVRLKVENKKLSEVETMIASALNAGVHFRPDLFADTAKVLDATVPAKQRMTRADLLKAAQVAWGQETGTALPVADSCLRYENLEPGAEPCRVGGGRQSGARNSRTPLVDVEKGIVVNYKLEDSDTPKGRRSTSGQENRSTPVFYYQPLTFYVMSLEKITDDKIQANALFMSLQELYVGTVFQ